MFPLALRLLCSSIISILHTKDQGRKNLISSVFRKGGMSLHVVFHAPRCSYVFSATMYPRSSFIRLLETTGWAAMLIQAATKSTLSGSSLPAVKDYESHFPGSWEEVYMERDNPCFNTIIYLPVGCTGRKTSIMFWGEKGKWGTVSSVLEYFSCYQAFVVLQCLTYVLFLSYNSHFYCFTSTLMWI